MVVIAITFAAAIVGFELLSMIIHIIEAIESLMSRSAYRKKQEHLANIHTPIRGFRH